MFFSQEGGYMSPISTYGLFLKKGNRNKFHASSSNKSLSGILLIQWNKKNSKRALLCSPITAHTSSFTKSEERNR